METLSDCQDCIHFPLKVFRVMQWDCYWVSLTGKPQVRVYTHTHTGSWARQAMTDIQSLQRGFFSDCFGATVWSHAQIMERRDAKYAVQLMYLTAQNLEYNKTQFTVRCLAELIKEFYCRDKDLWWSIRLYLWFCRPEEVIKRSPSLSEHLRCHPVDKTSCPRICLVSFSFWMSVKHVWTSRLHFSRFQLCDLGTSDCQVY